MDYYLLGKVPAKETPEEIVVKNPAELNNVNSANQSTNTNEEVHYD
jgi:hypothetical protein